jgi:membrane protease YdiL (CAAX protease family)
VRIPRWLAWLLIALAMFTAGLLRQFHDLTPSSPFVTPAVGSLLFACILFLFLVAARERQIGAAPGPGIRLGSLTPLLLMLLVEKWVSSGFYQPVFALAAPANLSADDADAWFRLLCGVGLLAITILVSPFSRPAAATLRRRLGDLRVATGVGAAAGAVVGAGAFLAAIGAAFGSRVSWLPPDAGGSLPVVIIGQGVLSFAEEIYYRGLVLAELLRLTPRLGLSSTAARRWAALGMTSVMFGMEHVGASSGWEDGARQLVFALALGTLLGLLVLLTDNLWFSASMHAWINVLLLGAVPRLGYGQAAVGLPPGASVSLALIGAFVAAYALQRRPRAAS